jgi:hypothetical protein
MKRIISIFTVVLIGGLARAQTIKESSVPAAVKTMLFSQYPNIKVTKWEKKKADYLSKFDENNVSICVVIDSNGNWVKTKAHIDASLLPKTAGNYMKKTYPKKKITDASKVSNSEGKVSYEAKVGDNTIVYFDAESNFTSAGNDK